MIRGDDDIVVVAGARTPFAGCHGPLSGWHPAALGARILRHLDEAAGPDPAVVDEVVVGTAAPVGAQGQNVARAMVLAAGWPESVSAHVIDADRLGGLLAIREAASLVAAGYARVVVAAGLDLMSLVPAGAAALNRQYGRPWGSAAMSRFDPEGLVPPPVLAERAAVAASLDRRTVDEWVLLSHARARSSTPAVVPVDALVDERGDPWPHTVVDADQHPDPAPGIEDLAGRAPLFEDGAIVTAANLSAPGDGVAAVVLTSRRHAREHGLSPIARLRAFATVASPPTGVAELATAFTGAAQRAGRSVPDVAVAEIDEYSAAQLLAAADALGLAHERVNLSGGSLAIGDPGAATGVRQVLDLIHGLDARGGAFGISVVGGDGGLAAALAIELED